MSELANSQNPWLGLASYSENESKFFFGREDEIGELLRLIQDEPLVVLYGISGLGKTSLLRAGVVPVLRQQEFLPIVIDRSHYDALENGSVKPSLSKAEQLVAGAKSSAAAETFSVSWSILNAVQLAAANTALPLNSGDSLWEYFHRTGNHFWSDRQRLLTPVLIFDQFEELFTTGSKDEYHRIRTKLFLKDLSDLVYNRPPAGFQERIETNGLKSEDYNFDPVPLRVVISLREDFLPHLSDLREQGFPTSLRAALRLRPLSEAAARTCIECPAPELLEPGVAGRLVNFLAGAETGPRSLVPDGSGSKPAPAASRSILKNGKSIEPALLSVVCRELNTERQRRGLPKISEGLLTLSQEQILADFYNRSFDGIAPELRRFVESELLSPGGYRDSRDLGDALFRPGITQAGIDQLIERRVLHYDDSPGGLRRIELTHDVLTGIARRSRDERRKEEADLLRREAEERERATRRRLFGTRLLLAVMVVLFALAVFAFLLASNEKQLADSNAKRADAETVDALAAKADSADANKRLEATNRHLRETNRNVRYQREVGEAYDAWDRGQLAKAHQLLEQDTFRDLHAWEWDFLEGLCSVRETGISRVLSGHTGAINRLLVRGQRQPMLISAGADATIRVWDAVSGQKITDFVSHREMVGLGFRFEQQKDDSAIIVNRIFAVGPAAKDGHLKRKDRIIAIAEGDSPPVQVSELSFDQITQRLEIGSEGKSVRIEVQHPDSGGHETIKLVSARYTTEVKHNREVVRMAVSPDGAFVASADAEDQICFWDVATGDLVDGTAVYTDFPIADLAFSPNGRWLAILFQDDRRLIFGGWRELRVPERPFPKQDKPIKAFAFAPNSQVAFATEDGIIHLLDIDQMQELERIQTDLDVRQLIFRPDGKVLAASSGLKIKIFDLENPSSPLRTLDTPDHNQLAFHPTGHYLATAGSDGVVRVWDLKTAIEVRTLYGHTGGVNCLAFLPDNVTLASGGEDHQVRLWNLRKFLPRNYRNFSIDDGVKHDIFGLCISPDGRYLASVKPWGSSIAVMDTTDGTLVRTLPANVFRTSFLPSESPWAVRGRPILMVPGDNFKIRFIDVTTGERVPNTPELAKHPTTVRGVAVSRKGDAILSADIGGNVYLWNYQSSEPVPLQEQISRKGDGIASAQIGGNVYLSNDQSNEQASLQEQKSMPTAVAISPDGAWAAVSFLNERRVRVWNLKTRESRDLPLAGPGYFLTFSPDSSLLLADEFNGCLHVVSLDTLSDKQTFWGHSGTIYDAVFSSDGRRIISTGADATIRLWDVETGLELFQLDNAATYYALAFSPDGLRLAGAQVNQVRMWNAALFSASQVEKDWVSCYSRGHYNEGLENWVQARDDYTAALQLHSNEPRLLIRLGEVEGELGDFAAAENDFEKVPSDSPKNREALGGLVDALLGQSKRSEFCQICQRLQKLAVASYDPQTANTAAWACSVIPEAGTDLAPLLELQRRVAKETPNDYDYQDTLGAILYRTGHYEEAISKLETAMSMRPRPKTPSYLTDGSNRNWDGTALDWVFLAMANYRLNDADHKVEANRWLDQADREVDLLAKDPFFDDPNYTWNWHDRVELETLCKEAHAFITQ